MSYLAIIAGLALLFGGGEAMLRGAVGVARKFHLSEVFVGVAIVGFATSAPELFVSVDAALVGRPGIALGNIIGSNTANLLLILAAGAVIRSVICRTEAIVGDAAMMTFGVVAVALICFVGGAGRVTGALLTAALVVYLIYRFKQSRSKPPEGEELPATDGLPTLALVGLLAGGLFALGLGAECLVYGAVSIAEAAGISERVISISLVALGTSLPELATAIVAAMRRQSDVAVGNVLGSCVFNVFGILGVTALVAPIAVEPAEFGPDAGVMALAGAIVLALAFFTGRVSRIAGACMIALYAAYIALLYAGPI